MVIRTHIDSGSLLARSFYIHMADDADLEDIGPSPGSSPSHEPELELDLAELAEGLFPQLQREDPVQPLNNEEQAVEQKVQTQMQSPWSITTKEAALLLECRSRVVPRHPAANKLVGGSCYSFFVEAGSAALGKRKKAQSSSSNFTAADEATSVVTAEYSAASGGSLTDLDDGSHLGVLRISGANQAKLHLTFGKYCLVLQPGHPQYDTPFPDGSTRETKYAGRTKTPFQHRAPDKEILWLVHATPEGTAAAAAVEKADTFRGDVRIGGSLMVGGPDLTVGPGGSGTVHAKLAGAEADHAEYMPVFHLRFDEAEELNGGDVVALVGDTDGVQKASRSARDSARAEWRVVSTNPQVLGNDIYDEDAAVPIVFSGQVPMRVTGKPPVDAFLVPSGREDGCARELSDEERPQNVLGQVVESRVKNGRVKALVQKGMGEEPMSRWVQREMDRVRGEIERVQAENVGLRMALQGTPSRSAAQTSQPAASAAPTPEASPTTTVPAPASPPPATTTAPASGVSSAAAAAAPARGEWPWDEVGKLGSDGRSVVTSADVALNRLCLVFKVISWGSGNGGLGVRRELADCLCGCSANANATIRATGETLRATGHGDTSEEALALAKWRLLEASNCQLLEMLAKCEAEARSSGSGDQGQTQTAMAIQNAGAKDAATSGKSRLNAMAHRLLAGQMSNLQGETLVEYRPSPPLGGSGSTAAGSGNANSDGSSSDDKTAEHAGFRSRGALPWCDGRPSFTGAVASTIKASEHSAAERGLAFVDRVVKSLTDPSYTFGFVKLSELLHDLRTTTRQAQEAWQAQAARVEREVEHEVSGLSISELREGLASGEGDPLEHHRRLRAAHEANMRSSFKELLHVLAMRLKRPPAIEASVDDQPNWRESARFLRYTAVPAEDSEDLGRSEHGTPLERAAVSFVQFDGEPTFVGAPAAGRKAAEQAAAEAALAFVFDRALAE